MQRDDGTLDQGLESHLESRLAEVRDVASFGRARPSAGETAVERSLELPEHLGGRKITDKFVRGGASRPATPPTEDSAKPKGLEHHLTSRLAEIQDSRFGAGSELDRMLDAYRKQRKDLGGS